MGCVVFAVLRCIDDKKRTPNEAGGNDSLQSGRDVLRKDQIESSIHPISVHRGSIHSWGSDYVLNL